MKREPLNLKLLPDEPTDGTGRLRIHYLVRDDAAGKIAFEKSLTSEGGSDGKLGALQQVPEGMVATAVSSGFRFKKRTAWRVACRPEQNTLEPQVVDGERLMCLTSPDPHTVTCPECRATADFIRDYAAASKPMEKVAADKAERLEREAATAVA